MPDGIRSDDQTSTPSVAMSATGGQFKTAQKKINKIKFIFSKNSESYTNPEQLYFQP